MFKSPINNIILTIETKDIASVANILKMATLNPGTQLNPANYANIIGDVVSVPVEVSKRRDYNGFSLKDIKVGDKVIFRYDVVWNWRELPEGKAEFRNMIFYRGKEFWKADIQQIFAVIRNNSIKMVNGYCMVENVAPKSTILLLRHDKKELMTTYATLTQIGSSLTTDSRIEAFPGDKVYFNPNILQEYEIRGKKFGIIPQSKIFGKEVGGYDGFKGMGMDILN